MQAEHRQRIATILGSPVATVNRLTGGCIADTYRITLADGEALVAKLGPAGSDLALEGWMLDYLARHSELPVPRVLHREDTLLLMTYVPADATLDAAAQTHAADLLARLHAVAAPAYGFERDTVLGGLRQPNPISRHWLPFFAEQRLAYMAEQAHLAGRLPAAGRHRVEALAGRIGDWLDEPDRPGLVHGDVWQGNILCHRTANGTRVAAFLDPAIYYADPEIELAYATLFDTLGAPFFDRYREHRPLSPGFFEVRRDLYNLFPLLTHVRLFGGHYIAAVERTLTRFGC